MTTTPLKQQRVEQLIEGAAGSLARKAYFEAERMALRALALAHQVSDFQRMALAVAPLLEARCKRRELALQVGTVTIVTETITENFKFSVGCFLIEPPQVGADARRLRMASLQSEIPAAVVCREPLTKLGLCPIVAIGPGATVRTKVQPPADPAKPDLEWFTSAMEALGEEAAACIDGEADPQRRIKQILDLLDTVPDSDGLHLLLEQTCHIAAKLPAQSTKAAATKAKA